jgi:hypothetical protein
MTLGEVDELAAYWVGHPPLHIAVAAYLGLGHRSRNQIEASMKSTSNLDSTALCAALGPGFAVADVDAGLAPVVLDIAELRRRTTS